MSDREEFEKSFGELMDLSPEDMVWQPERRCYQELAVHWAWKAWQIARSTPKQGEERTVAITERQLTAEIERGFMAGAKHAMETIVPQAVLEISQKLAAPPPSVEPAPANKAEFVSKLWMALRHGSEEHQEWLHQAIACFVWDKPIQPYVAPPPLQVEPGWQPIETAPKDGSYFLAANQWGVWCCHYQPSSASGWVFDDPWRSVMLNHWHIADKAVQYHAATHWMPLPPAPKEPKP